MNIIKEISFIFEQLADSITPFIAIASFAATIIKNIKRLGSFTLNRVSSKENKIISRVIIKKQKDEGVISTIVKYIYYLLDLASVVVFPLLLELIMNIFFLMINVGNGYVGDNICLGIILGSVIVGPLLIYAVTTSQNLTIKKIKWEVFAIVESYYALLLIYKVLLIEYWLIVIICIATLWYFLFNCIWKKIIFNNQYIVKKLWSWEVLRYTLLVTYLFIAIDNNGAGVIWFNLSMVVVCIQYFIIAFFDNKFLVNLIIHKENGNIIETIDGIYKAIDGRIECKTKDGVCNLISQDEIDYFSYEFNKSWIKYSGEKYRTLCLLKGKAPIYYDGYYFIDKEWIAFFNQENRHKEVHVYNLGKIEKFG